jgi:PAS domain-containing protein
MLAVSGDLAAQRDADSRLREREEWFAETQAVAKLASWTWDVAADEVTWSPEFYEMLGMEPGSVETTYEGFMGLIHPDDRAAAEGALTRALEGGDSYAVAHRLVGPEGNERMTICRGRVYRDPDGKPLRMVGASLDFSDYMGIAQELRTSHEQLLAAEKLAEVGSFEFDPRTGVVTWSDGMYALFRLRPDEFDGTLDGYLRHVHPDDRERRRADLERALEEREPLASTQRIRRGDGTAIRIESRVEVESTPEGEISMRGVCWEAERP